MKIQYLISHREILIHLNHFPLNVYFLITGLYSCTLRNKTININQEGFVTETQIIQAPVVRLQGEVNVRCQNGQIQPLKCCVQRPYTVKWFQGIVPLNSGK